MRRATSGDLTALTVKGEDGDQSKEKFIYLKGSYNEDDEVVKGIAEAISGDEEQVTAGEVVNFLDGRI